MTCVKCSVNSCAYCKDGGCYIEKINIGGKGAAGNQETCCGSFLNQSGYSNLADFTSNRCAASEVECNVDTCRYNNGHQCSLKEINVAGNPKASIYTETNCASYQAR